MRKNASSLIFYEGKVLLLLRDNNPDIPHPNMWQSIGGRVDEGEGFDTAIRREIKEETNLEPKDINYLGKLVLSEQEIAVYLIYLGEDEIGHLKLGNEGQELRLFSVEELDNLELTPVVKGFLTKYRNQYIKLSKGLSVDVHEIGLN